MILIAELLNLDFEFEGLGIKSELVVTGSGHLELVVRITIRRKDNGKFTTSGDVSTGLFCHIGRTIPSELNRELHLTYSERTLISEDVAILNHSGGGIDIPTCWSSIANHVDHTFLPNGLGLIRERAEFLSLNGKLVGIHSQAIVTALTSLEAKEPVFQIAGTR